MHRYPEPKLLSGTQLLRHRIREDPHSNRLVVMSAIDNLMKGAAGQAVQAFNIMHGLPETTGPRVPRPPSDLTCAACSPSGTRAVRDRGPSAAVRRRLPGTAASTRATAGAAPGGRAEAGAYTAASRRSGKTISPASARRACCWPTREARFRNEGIAVENNMPFLSGRHGFVFNGELRGVRIAATGRIGAEKLFRFPAERSRPAAAGGDARESRS